MSQRWMGVATIVWGLLALSGCEGASADATTPPGKVAAVVTSISSVTLAEDCTPPPPPSAKAATGDHEHVNEGDAENRSCQQSSVQLSLATGAGSPAAFTVVKAQLFSDKGALLQQMQTRNPRVWDKAGRYQAWEAVAQPNQKLQVTYDLNAPDWSKMGGSQQAARGKSFRLVLTVRAGGKESKVESVVRSPEVTMEPTDVT